LPSFLLFSLKYLSEFWWRLAVSTCGSWEMEPPRLIEEHEFHFLSSDSQDTHLAWGSVLPDAIFYKDFSTSLDLSLDFNPQQFLFNTSCVDNSPCAPSQFDSFNFPDFESTFVHNFPALAEPISLSHSEITPSSAVGLQFTFNEIEASTSTISSLTSSPVTPQSSHELPLHTCKWALCARTFTHVCDLK
jgi:hypothetical protein